MQWISFEVASSCINKQLPVFLEVFEAFLESTFWNNAVLSLLFECLECQHSDSLSILLSVVGIRRNRKATNPEIMAARQYSYLM
jgi:hypothetical protein